MTIFWSFSTFFHIVCLIFYMLVDYTIGIFLYFLLFMLHINNPTCPLEIAMIAHIQPFHVEIFTLGYHG
jgi:hypothetical protein